jgi:hypothetical protein
MRVWPRSGVYLTSIDVQRVTHRRRQDYHDGALNVVDYACAKAGGKVVYLLTSPTYTPSSNWLPTRWSESFLDVEEKCSSSEDDLDCAAYLQGSSAWSGQQCVTT